LTHGAVAVAPNVVNKGDPNGFCPKLKEWAGQQAANPMAGSTPDLRFIRHT
jgi:hypothetical protein